MKKIAIAAGIAVAVFAGAASAQSYYSNYSYTPSYNSCASIGSTLAIGSTGSSVTALQQYLVAQNYSGSGSWMITGYFGQATASAVRIFQEMHGLPVTGSVDSSTLAAMSCGSGAYGYGSYPNTSAYNYYPNYNYQGSYPYGYNPYNSYNGYNRYTNYGGYGYNGYNGYNYPYTAPAITSLSQNTGFPGNTITIYGQGFDYSNNTVYFNGQSYYGISSQNGTSISFTIPYVSLYGNGANQTVQLSVGTSHGMTNTEDFTLNPNTSGNYNYNCGTYSYGYSNCGNCGSYYYGYNGYNNCNGCSGSTYCSNCGSYYSYTCGSGNTNSPSLTYMNPSQGGVGTLVTIYGSGFTTSGNTVHFGNGVITGLQSPDGQSLSFTVPSQITGYGSQPVVVSTYQISVTNGNGYTTNTSPFTVTSTNSYNGAPTITNVSGPTSLTTGAQATWSMTVNAQGNSYASVSASWGDTNGYYVNMAAPQTVYGSQTVTFTHAYYTAGTYTITFMVANQSGQSNTYTTTITVSGSSANTGAPTISSISPNSAYTGQQVTIYGSNFRQGDVINFGAGVVQNVYAYGSTITFTVPSSVGPYCQSGYMCPQYAIPVNPGTYNVSVMDPWYGTSNTLSFTVL